MSQYSDNTAAICEQFGVSPKALRLYERLGMLVPPRTSSGWRSYGPKETERLHQILSLKQLGLPLARIAELLRGGSADLTALLEAQEVMLDEVRRDAEHALKLLRIAKIRLRDTGSLPAIDLASLVRKISQTLIRTTPELEELAARIYTPEQRGAVFGPVADEELAAWSGLWEYVRTALDALPTPPDPASHAALEIGRRMIAMFRKASAGDKELWNNSYLFWKSVHEDPRLSAQLPMPRARWEFVGAIFGELAKRGEFQFEEPLRES